MTRTKQTSRQIGDTFEQMACAFLCEQGLKIVQTNFVAPRVGEIDIIACDTHQPMYGQSYPVLVFVEVKARRHGMLASASETVTKTKQRRLIEAAKQFLQSHDVFLGHSCRFDVIAFDIDKTSKPTMHWIKAAFLAE